MVVECNPAVCTLNLLIILFSFDAVTSLAVYYNLNLKSSYRPSQVEINHSCSPKKFKFVASDNSIKALAHILMSAKAAELLKMKAEAAKFTDQSNIDKVNMEYATLCHDYGMFSLIDLCVAFVVLTYMVFQSLEKQPSDTWPSSDNDDHKTDNNHSGNNNHKTDNNHSGNGRTSQDSSNNCSD